MIDLTEIPQHHLFNVNMTFSIIVAVMLIGGCAAAGRHRRYNLITRRPYNNQYSDASAARDERSLMLS